MQFLKKYLFFIYSLLCFAIISNAQYITEYFINNNRVSEDIFKKRGETGVIKVRSIDGPILSVSEMCQGKLNGKHIEYFKNGKKASLIEYSMGIQTGRILKWRKNGILLASGKLEYKDCKMNYNLEEFFSNGHISKKILVQNGVGIEIEFHENGLKSSEVELLEKVYHGKYRMWDDSGHLLVEGSYKNGVIDRLWRDYYKNGIKKSEEHFSEGQLNGIYIMISDN